MTPAEPLIDSIVYVANSGDGTISSYRLDHQAERLMPLTTTIAEDRVMPMAISPDKRFLYAAARGEQLKVLSYRIEPEGKLALLGSGKLQGSMAYIATDRDGRYLLAASYGDNVISLSPIGDDGVVGDATQTLETGSRAHAILATPDNRHVFATNLGDDRLVQYRLDGKLVPNEPPSVATAEGCGPRHFVFSPNGRFVYVLGELDAAVTTYALDAESGTLSLLSSCKGLSAEADLAPGMPQENIPEGDTTPRVWAADLHVTPDGRHVYLSERTTSTLSILRANPETGELSFVGSQPTVKQPRGFKLDPSGRFLIAAGELSDHLALYRIDTDSGELTHVDDAPVGAKANWIEIL